MKKQNSSTRLSNLVVEKQRLATGLRATRPANESLERQIDECKSVHDQSLQAQKMEAVGKLAGGLAHDFNNIMTGIAGYTQLLLEQMEPDSLQAKDLLQIRKLVERATNLTALLLAFSRKQKLEAQVLNLSTIVGEFEPMLRPLMGKDIEIVVEAGSKLGQVRVDPVQMERVLMNLAVNALDAMPDGGTLVIEISNVLLGREYTDTHEWVLPGPYVMLAVSDTGCGMDKAMQKQIFEPFFSTKEAGKGTGLGLSTVYGIVKQHNGYILVYSQPGKGTSFKIYLPRVDAEGEGLLVEAKDRAVPRAPETILAVDDDEAVRALVERVLEGEGYTVLVAANPDEAEEVFMQWPSEITLLLSDVVMPGGDGPDLYRCLTAKYPLKVLYMSGYTHTLASRRHLLDGNPAYLPKPFTPDDLTQRVRETLDHKDD
ncbi:ATP-binding protein [Acidobacteria bacterium AH-259-A15]|nr:ATP-binding protein [Acidobacteria bacterium AH-259-A15]